MTKPILLFGRGPATSGKRWRNKVRAWNAWLKAMWARSVWGKAERK